MDKMRKENPGMYHGDQFFMKKDILKQLIKEEIQSQQLSSLFKNAINQVDESLSYSEFAKAIAQILKDDYGSHNFGPFMEVLHKELGIE